VEANAASLHHPDVDVDIRPARRHKVAVLSASDGSITHVDTWNIRLKP
jgi:hypothetical protein